MFRFHPGMLTLNGLELNAKEIAIIHARYGLSPSLATSMLRALATVRYKLRNIHRLRDKTAAALAGKKSPYRA